MKTPTLKLNSLRRHVLLKTLDARDTFLRNTIEKLQQERNEVNLIISELNSREARPVVKTKASEQAIARERLGEARRINDSKVVRE